VAILLIMLSLDLLLRAAIIATLGASTFVVFGIPQSRAAQPRSLLLGYAFGCSVGGLLSYLCGWCGELASSPEDWLPIVMGALAVGLAMLLMVITDSEHPPAAGMALGLVLRPWAPVDLALVMLAVALLTGVGWLLRDRLVDLT
jgi:CBS-domain-containing membrane protein